MFCTMPDGTTLQLPVVDIDIALLQMRLKPKLAMLCFMKIY